LHDTYLKQTLTNPTNFDGEKMYIVFEDQIESLKQRYVVLELDTFLIPETNQRRTAYCVLESFPLDELTNLESHVKVHQDILQNYRIQNWTYCEHAIEGMRGKWAGVLDSFYDDLLSRVKQYQEQPPAADWDGVRIKTLDDAKVLPQVHEA
jgi:hypothetical protein